MKNYNYFQEQPNGENQQLIPPYSYMPYSAFYKKEYPPLDKKDSRFIFLFLLCAVVFADFALFRGFHLGFTLSYAVIFGLSSAYLWNKDSRPGAFPLLCGVISLAGSVTLSLYSNIFVNVIMVLLIAGLFTLYCLGISGAFNRSQNNFKILFDLFEGAVIHPIKNFADVFGSVKVSAKKGGKEFASLLGILFALPVLLVIIPLLVSSDAAFEGLVTSIVKNIGIYLLEFVVALIITPFIYSFMFGKRHGLNKKEDGVKKSARRLFIPSGSVSFLSVISLVYAVYLFSQLAYFFSAFKGILPEGYNHSASVYARRGFFEMVAVVAINIALISVVSAFTKRKEGKLPAGVKGVSLFISLFSVLMLVIAAQKMRLNIETYGYSRNRLLVCAFMVMMLIVIAFFIIHIFAPKVPYMQAIIISCSIIFVVLSFADINALTAEYNTSAYNEGILKSINVEYLAELGDSTVPSLIKLTESDNKKVAAKAKISLVKYAAESKMFTADRDNNLRYVQKDFRSFVKVKSDSAKALFDYYDALDAAEKEKFMNDFNLFTDFRFDYNQESDAYENWEYDSGYRYNNKTGEYVFEEVL